MKLDELLDELNVDDENRIYQTKSIYDQEGRFVSFDKITVDAVPVGEPALLVNHIDDQDIPLPALIIPKGADAYIRGDSKLDQLRWCYTPVQFYKRE